jgi:hypothetical protein
MLSRQSSIAAAARIGNSFRAFIHDFPTFWRKIVGICLRHFSKNVPVLLNSVYHVLAGIAAMVVKRVMQGSSRTA